MRLAMLRPIAAVLGAIVLALAVCVVSSPSRADAAISLPLHRGISADICTPFVSICVDPGTVIDALLPGVTAAKEAFTAISGVIGEQAAGLVASIFGYMTDGLLSAVGSLLGQFQAFLDGSTHADVTSTAFLAPNGTYHRVAAIASVLLIGFLLLGVIQGLFAGEPGQMLLRIARDVPLAVLAIIGIPWIVAQLLDLVDGISAYVLPTGDTFKTLAAVYTLDNFKGLGNGILGIPALLLALLAFLAALAVYAELVVRAALVYVCVALAPMSFAAIVWPAARPAARKVVELLGAVIASKFVICVALAVGLDLFADHATAAPWQGAPWGHLVVGTAIICLAAFAPWITWRLMPLAEGAVIAQGLARSPARAGQQAMQQSFYLRQMHRSATGAGASASGGAQQGGAAATSAPGASGAAGPIGAAVAVGTATVQRGRQQVTDSASKHVESTAPTSTSPSRGGQPGTPEPRSASPGNPQSKQP
jgi:hypothetical protein